jgi:predicted 2-oxoglutarate/Fe(II)-dependent dioxygenase YbiX/peroxiredoxin
MSHPPFRPGDPVPWFTAASTSNPNYRFDTVAGRYVALCFLGSAARAEVCEALHVVEENRTLFDDSRAAFFGISVDPQDQQLERVRQVLPGIRFLWDFERAVSRAFGAADGEGHASAGKLVYRPYWLVLDPMLRVIVSAPLSETQAVMRLIADLPPLSGHAGGEMHAPVLVLPRVFEPEFCRHLTALYEANGGTESGFMREENGKTVGVLDHSFKRRADHSIADEATCQAARARILRRIVPEIHKVFQFRVTRMERYIVACYDSRTGGHFRAHRDNTTKGTAHRRFAVTINLNAEEYEGGDLRFPEFGPRTYRAPTGGAVVFSCSLLHEATPVTAGRRFAFLPFLYDDAAARMRAANNPFLGEGIGEYRTGQ